MLQPPTLQAGDKAVILSPAGKIEPGLVNGAATLLRSWGLSVEIAGNALCEAGRFSGSVDQRLDDLQHAMDDPTVRLIFCSRGGYGTVHLLDRLDFEMIRQYPKWVVGYSDITALHAALQSHGIISLHGPMAKHFAEEGPGDIAVRYTKAILTGEPVNYDIPVTDDARLNRKGEAAGRLFGGNLSVFCGVFGTRFAYTPKNGILFIEDIGEEPYKIDRYIHQLKLSGIFERISGLIVGQFTNYSEDGGMYATLNESIAFAVSGYGFPVCFNFPVGHVRENFPLLMGKEAKFIVEENGLIFKQN